MSEVFDNNTSMYQAPQKNGDESKGMAIASMVLGIVSIVTVCVFYYASIPCGIIGIVLGVMHNKKSGKCGMTTAGIICSVIGIILAIIVLILAIVGMAALGLSLSELSNYSY